MAKRKKKNSNSILSVVPLILSVIVMALMFLDVVKYTGKVLGTETFFKGFNVIFGLTEKTTLLGATIENKILSFSVLALVAVCLPMVAAVVQLSQNKILKLVGFILAAGGAVMLFIMPSFVVFANEVTGALYGAAVSSIAIGGIIAGIVASVEALIIGYTLLKK